MSMPLKKDGGTKKTMRIVPMDGSRTSLFVVTYTMNGEKQTKEFASRSDLFSWVRGAEMFNISPESIVRTVSEIVTVEKTR